ncbi:MAG TPA: lactate utilization protein [Gemmataceae bacterium]|nr:lactate utilization protein [Gemmataceae bacterium]
MTSGREAMLQRIREAVATGNRVGGTADSPRRGNLGYQGAGPDAAVHFLQQFAAAGGIAHPVADGTAAVARVLELIQARSARRVLLGHGRLLDPLRLAEPLRERGLDVQVVSELAPETCREPLFAADISISEADYLIAETGSLAIAARQGEPRSLSLLPPVHIVLADHTHLIPDLFDLFERYGTATLPSCLALITGPSKTGDIELRLVTGVHGPGEVHVVFVGS